MTLNSAVFADVATICRGTYVIVIKFSDRVLRRMFFDDVTVTSGTTDSRFLSELAIVFRHVDESIKCIKPFDEITDRIEVLQTTILFNLYQG